MVTLEIPPYRFKRKTDAKEIGKKAYFECNSCEKLDEKTSAHAIKLEDDNGEIFYELVFWPLIHECMPSATSHLARKYKCPTCDKSYTKSHNLKKHREKEHGL